MVQRPLAAFEQQRPREQDRRRRLESERNGQRAPLSRQKREARSQKPEARASSSPHRRRIRRWSLEVRPRRQVDRNYDVWRTSWHLPRCQLSQREPRVCPQRVLLCSSVRGLISRRSSSYQMPREPSLCPRWSPMTSLLDIRSLPSWPRTRRSLRCKMSISFGRPWHLSSWTRCTPPHPL